MVSVQDNFPATRGSLNTSTSLLANSSGEVSTNIKSHTSPYVHASVARKHRGTIAWMAAGIGAVGLFMFSC